MKANKARRGDRRCSVADAGQVVRAVSASRLAEMGFCERWVVLEQRHGRPRSRRQQLARKRGVESHARFERQGRLVMRCGTLPTTEPKGRCFVATLAFGEEWQTQALRHFRDTVLRRRAWGRSIIYHYCRAGSRICEVLASSPVALSCVRWLLGQVARLWRWWSRDGA